MTLRAVQALRNFQRVGSDSRLHTIHWLPHQERMLRSHERFRLLRTGNQLGKTTAGLAEVIFHATGRHPYKPVRKDPGQYWIVCTTWPQSVEIQAKLYELLPRHLLHPSTRFDPVKGFRSANPSVRVKCGDGWSIIRFKTTQQGTLNLAGATIDGVLFDEPPKNAEVYGEIVKRVQARNGWVLLCLTPIGAPCDWLRALCERGAIEDIHSPLTPEAMIPVGAHDPLRLPDGTPCDLSWIEEITAQTLYYEVPVRIHGEWELRSEEAFFSKVWREHFITTALPPTDDFAICLGIDHGDRPGKQVALIVLVEPTTNGNRLWVLDEYTDTAGTATPDDDARGILAVLHRNGIGWSSIDHAFSDRVHLPGSARQKSAADLAAAISKQIGIPLWQLTPKIRTVKRGEGHGAGSLSVGSRWLCHAMQRDLFRVHPRCKRLVESIPKYELVRGGRDAEWKDPVDALRYALDAYIFAPVQRGGGASVRFG